MKADTDLMAGILRRDQRALAALYDRYAALLYSLAYHVLQDRGLAEETAQDIFLKVWQQAVSWDPARGKLVSWLLTLTRYAAIDRLRKEMRRPLRQSYSLDDLHDVIPDDSTVDSMQQLEAEALRQLMDKLPNEQAQVVYLAFFHGLSHSEIAEQTAVPLGTIKTRLRLAMHKLKDMWSAQMGSRNVGEEWASSSNPRTRN